MIAAWWRRVRIRRFGRGAGHWPGRVSWRALQRAGHPERWLR